MKVEFIHGTPPRADLDGMFGGWLTECQGRTYLVDSGVGSVGQTLVDRLKQRLGDRPLDYVLLTHIHLDHAGGLPQVFAAWPESRAVAHARGLKHLVKPGRLWESTREVMGELADTYGEPRPLPVERFIPHTEANLPGVTIFETPGHAEHHLSYRVGETMFVGEAGGCPIIYEGRVAGRPSTPPRFFPEVTLASVDLLLKEPDGLAYFGHTSDPMPMQQTLKNYKEQINLWLQILRHPPVLQGDNEDRRDYLLRLVEEMYRLDPELGSTLNRPEAEVRVEKFFMGNAINGFLLYFEGLARGAEASRHNAA